MRRSKKNDFDNVLARRFKSLVQLDDPVEAQDYTPPEPTHPHTPHVWHTADDSSNVYTKEPPYKYVQSQKRRGKKPSPISLRESNPSMADAIQRYREDIDYVSWYQAKYVEGKVFEIKRG